jgi:hypothetical protein
MFGKIKRFCKAVMTGVSLLVAILPTLLSPEMRAVYANLAR